LNITETSVGVVEGESIELIEDRNINAAVVEERVERFNSGVRSNQ